MGCELVKACLKLESFCLEEIKKKDNQLTHDSMLSIHEKAKKYTTETIMFPFVQFLLQEQLNAEPLGFITLSLRSIPMLFPELEVAICSEELSLAKY